MLERGHGHPHPLSSKEDARRRWPLPFSLLCISFSLPPSSLGKWKIAHQFFAGNGKGVTMANGLPLLEGLWEGGLDVCPSALEKWTSVAMVMGMWLV